MWPIGVRGVEKNLGSCSLLGHSLDESYYLTGMMACALTSSSIMSYLSFKVGTQITLSRERAK